MRSETFVPLCGDLRGENSCSRRSRGRGRGTRRKNGRGWHRRGGRAGGNGDGAEGGVVVVRGKGGGVVRPGRGVAWPRLVPIRGHACHSPLVVVSEPDRVRPPPS